MTAHDPFSAVHGTLRSGGSRATAAERHSRQSVIQEQALQQKLKTNEQNKLPSLKESWAGQPDGSRNGCDTRDEATAPETAVTHVAKLTAHPERPKRIFFFYNASSPLASESHGVHPENTGGHAAARCLKSRSKTLQQKARTAWKSRGSRSWAGGSAPFITWLL